MARTIKKAPGRAGSGNRPRLPLLALTGVLLIVGAWGLRSSPWTRERVLRGTPLSELEAAVRRDPGDPVAGYLLAKRYYLERRFADAVPAYRQVLAQEPRSDRGHLGLALSLYELGDLAAAQQEFEQALRLNPRLAWAEYMLGKIAWLRGQVGQALPRVQRATELDPRSGQAWYALGVCLLHQRRYEDAIRPLQQAIALEESNPRYRTALGELLVYRGRTEEGHRELDRAVELGPEDGPACALAGNFYLRKAAEPDALTRAEALLKRAARLKTYHPEQVYLDLGELYYQKREYRRAEENLQESIRLDPRDERPYFTLARVYRRLGDDAAAARAEARFNRISRLHVEMQTVEARVFHNASDWPSRLRLARVYRELGLAPQALAQYSAYLKAKPGAREVQSELQRWAGAAPSPAPRGETRDFTLPPFR